MVVKKIVLVGCGAVGSTFLYSAINQNLAKEYILIDKFENLAQGNALDLQDVQATLETSFALVRMGNFQDCHDADLVVITAGRPRKVAETRLDMVVDNAKIIKDIALQIKLSGFKGITLIASNPVDIMTTVYQKVSGFDIHKVLGAGTILDTLRLKYLLGEKLNADPKTIDTYVLGEHGDSSFIAWSIGGCNKKSLIKLLSQTKRNMLEQEVKLRAGQIIKLKHATFYGIASGLTFLIKKMFEDKNAVVAGGAYLNGEYGNQGLYIGVPVVLNKNGWKEIVEFSLTTNEQEKFDHSCQILAKNLTMALTAIEDDGFKYDSNIARTEVS